MKIRPEIFSNPANISAVLHADEFNKGDQFYNQMLENINQQESLQKYSSQNYNSSQINNYKNKSMFLEPFDENDEQVYHNSQLQERNKASAPLKDRLNYPSQNYLENHKGPKHKMNNISQSKENNSETGLRRQLSMDSLQGGGNKKSLKKFQSYFNERDVGNEEKTNDQFVFEAAGENRNPEINSEYLENNNVDLLKNVQRLGGELQRERSRSAILEDEVRNLTLNLTEERAKYQEEFVKISQKIKNFQDIQGIYRKEKKTSQCLEHELIQREKFIEGLQDYLK